MNLNFHENFCLFSQQPKVHPALEYFRQLQSQPSKLELKRFLSIFAEPKLVNYENFVEGTKKFIALANSNSIGKGLSRVELYGNSYSGLHYNNDLVELWNAEHSDKEHLKASQVTLLTPPGWKSTCQNSSITLIYKGQEPAQALDNLVKGPTVIDCGMFTQLSIWFGIRYMLGNERFNQYFGRAPFFVTQINYNKIEKITEPFSGNPLYSFLSKKETETTLSVTVRYLSNTPLYNLKHPGGNSAGHNCLVIDHQYYIFAPLLESNQGITETNVLNLMRSRFNEDRQPYDLDRLSEYASTPKKFHPHLRKKFAKLIKLSEKLRYKILSDKKFSRIKQNDELELTFDLHKFSVWLQRMENAMQLDAIDYLPQIIDYSLMPTELLDVIPFENRKSMDFSKFTQESPQQNELILISKQFCQSIMACESKLVILTGKAGVGKTASAVCAAKELTARGKKVVWISEVMVSGWAAQAKSIKDLDNCELEIDKLISSNPDVVFLDDDNLAGFSGNLLLEKIYFWFVINPGKGLFITSNEPIRFQDCYRYKSDNNYYFPPFNDYTSPEYINWQLKADLTGVSLRSKRDGQSIGAIVSDMSWETNQGNLQQVELIPDFNDEELAPIRVALKKQGHIKCDAYDKLRPVQKTWIREHEAGGTYMLCIGRESEYIEPFLTVNPATFEHTNYKTIALEIGETNYRFCEKKISLYSMNQLIRVLNYAHDQGGRRVILINKTSYSHEQLLIQIKAQLPKSESERCWSRLTLLLCETEDSIFSYNQFNGHIDVTQTTINSLQESSQSYNELSNFDIQTTIYAKGRIEERPFDSVETRIFKR